MGNDGTPGVQGCDPARQICCESVLQSVERLETTSPLAIARSYFWDTPLGDVHHWYKCSSKEAKNMGPKTVVSPKSWWFPY